MITLVHCNIEDAQGPAVNLFARASDCIFKNCYRAIDNRDDLPLPRQLTSALFNVTARVGNTAIQFNLFINITDTAIAYSDHANGVERQIRRNTFVNCPIAIDRSDPRFDAHPEAYDGGANTFTQVLDNVFDGVDHEIKQNYAPVSEDWNLSNGSLDGTIAQGTNSIGPGLAPRYLDESAENYRLKRAGVLNPDGTRPLLNSPGALAGSGGLDMGAYHRSTSAASLFARDVQLDSPHKSNFSMRAISAETAEGLGFVHGGTTGHANQYDLDYNNDVGHTRQAALHAFRSIRASKSDICWSRLGEILLPTPSNDARIIRDTPAEMAKWSAIWHNDPIYGLRHISSMTIDRVFNENTHRPNENRYKCRVSSYANLPANVNPEWFIGCILKTNQPGITDFDTYNTTGNAGTYFTTDGYPNFWLIVEYGSDDIGPFFILDPIYAVAPFGPTDVMEGSITRAEWMGAIVIVFSGDRIIAELRGLSSIPDAYPGLFDGFNLSISYASQIPVELPLPGAYIPIGGAPWYVGNHRLLSTQLAAFRLKSVTDLTLFAYTDQYELEPIGPTNPFIVENLSDADKTKIASSLFVAGIYNQFVVPTYDEISLGVGTESTRDEWASQGSDYLPTTSIVRETTSRAMAGAVERYVQTAVPRQAWPFERG